MIIYMINYDNMLRIRHEHTSHDDILNIPPWSKHLPRMPHSPQKLRRFCSQQACKRCERRSRGRFPIFWSQFHEFALSRCLRQKKSASNFFTVSICLLLFAVSQAPTTRMTRNRTFLKRAMPPCRPCRPCPCHAWADASSQCIARSFVIFYCAAVLTILHETKYRNEDIGKSTTFLSRSLWLWYLSLF